MCLYFTRTLFLKKKIKLTLKQTSGSLFFDRYFIFVFVIYNASSISSKIVILSIDEKMESKNNKK